VGFVVDIGNITADKHNFGYCCQIPARKVFNGCFEFLSVPGFLFY
jgi:hypothetical protein